MLVTSWVQQTARAEHVMIAFHGVLVTSVPPPRALLLVVMVANVLPSKIGHDLASGPCAQAFRSSLKSCLIRADAGVNEPADGASSSDDDAMSPSATWLGALPAVRFA